MCETCVRIDLEVLYSLTHVANLLDESPGLNSRDIFVLADDIHGDVPLHTQGFRRSEEVVRDIDKHCAIFLFVFSHLRNCGCSLTTQDEILSLLRWFLKRNKNSSCIRLPVKVHFWTRIYSTCQQKLILYIPHLCKKVNRMHKKQPQMRLFQNDFRGYMTSSHKKECGSTHYISRVVSLLFLCGPEDFALLAPAQRLLRLAGREVSQLLHQWSPFLLMYLAIR